MMPRTDPLERGLVANDEAAALKIDYARLAPPAQFSPDPLTREAEQVGNLPLREVDRWQWRMLIGRGMSLLKVENSSSQPRGDIEEDHRFDVGVVAPDFLAQQAYDSVFQFGPLRQRGIVLAPRQKHGGRRLVRHCGEMMDSPII